MSFHQIWKSSYGEKFIFALYDSEHTTTAYGIVLAEPGFKHLCGYLNLDKEQWLQVSDSIREQDAISFEGIESTRLSIPSEFNRKVPITIWPYWIGIDHMGDTRIITPNDVAGELCLILNHIGKLWQPF